MKNFFNKHCLCNKKITLEVCSCLRKYNVLFLDPYINIDGNCFLTMHKETYYASFFLEASCVSVDLSPLENFSSNYKYPEKEFTFEISYRDFNDFKSQEEYLIYFNKVCDRFISNLIFT